jgi:hypothetical protein
MPDSSVGPYAASRRRSAIVARRCPFENGCDLDVVTIAPWTIRLPDVDAADLGLFQDAKPSNVLSPHRLYSAFRWSLHNRHRPQAFS